MPNTQRRRRHSNALGRSTSRDRTRLRLAGPRSLLTTRFALRARETEPPGGRDGLALSESTTTSVAAPSGGASRTGVYVTARPARRCRPPLAHGSRRSPFAPRRSLRSRLASLATDQSGHAGALHTARARSGLNCMCPRRQRVSPSVAPLAGFRVPALGAACAVARHTAARVLGDSRLDTNPHIGPDTSGHIPLAARSRRVGARCWLDGLPEARSRSRPMGAREGASESAQMVLSVVVVEEIRDVGASRCRARERLQEPVSSNVK